MKLSRYKAVFFDVGGTLLRVHPSVGEVYARNARSYGFEGSAEEVDRQFGLAWKEMGGLESLGRQSGPEVERRFWREIVRRAFEPLGGLRDFDTYFAHIYQVFMEAENWQIYDDVVKSGILESLRRRGAVLGVISNWDSRLEGILQATGLAKHFDFILASTVVGSAKPDRGIFEEALRLSGIAPSEACHIGDEYRSDYQGAQGVGIDAILLDRKGSQSAPAPTIRSFMELV